ncbi:MAG: hypothetical protein QOD12_2479 [Verrucomicrobiota bacterium]|jgi:hypothetical protein
MLHAGFAESLNYVICDTHGHKAILSLAPVIIAHILWTTERETTSELYRWRFHDCQLCGHLFNAIGA